MNKLLVSAIAGAAGLTLLLGGAGTFALWNSSTSIAGGTITAGTLLIADSAPTNGVWKSGSTVITMSSYRIVPGDTITYTKSVDITATGDNLVATAVVDPASIVPTNAATPADIKLASYITKTAALAITGSGITGTSPSLTITPTATGGATRTATVTVSVTFPKNGTPGFENDAKLGSVNLGALAVTLTQTT
ncbi:alternate-type signal peptide domain-containing protein [Cryobacterium sp. TMT1-66-1]|uniref:alternate-type signal peptide domain-containing protein n=1 Tax=Cryobacterium sp. TMT1-66-1 TaxID=1259242 RepID=UPI00106D2F4B|nr:alternate-type signal peptide domain-containing protein [Cryobacterium sp. TMT1-66-1]TFD07061.1 alternate-type signal peptide domain-containing protein [Cryobacterium sp. TMT1-66-1]